MVAAIAQTHNANAGNTITMGAYTAGSRLCAYAAGRGGGHMSRAGWTHVADVLASSDKLCMLWRASAGESTSFAFSTDGVGGRNWITEITGVGDPIQNTSSANATSIGHDTLTLTGVAAGSMLMLGVVGSAADVWSGGLWTQSAGWTEDLDTNEAGHPFPMSAHQVASGAGSYSASPQHGNDWSGWSPRGEAMLMLEFPVSGGGGGGSTFPQSQILIAFRRTLWALGPPLWRPDRRLVVARSLLRAA